MNIKQDIDTLKDVLDGITAFTDSVTEYQCGFACPAIELQAALDPSLDVKAEVEKFATNYKNAWTLEVGKNWIRVIHEGEVYAFVCIDKNPKKTWLQVGDILRPASYAQPSLNFNRGNVIHGRRTWLKYITAKGIK